VPDYRIGTREEWQAARDELAKLEDEHTKLGQRVTEQRRQLPWVPVEKEYTFDTQDGKKTLAELFDGRSQLLAYNIMFGPDYELGACPGCSNLGDELDATRVHLNHRDVTLICFSRAPIDRLNAYKQRMGWQFPYVSTYGTEFPFDYGIALTPEQVASAEHPGQRRRVDGESGCDEMIDPRLDAAGRAEVVERQSEQDRVGRQDLLDDLLGQLPRDGLGRSLLLGRHHSRPPGLAVQVRQRVRPEVTVGDRAARMRRPPGGGCARGQGAADRPLPLEARVDVQ
jgi:predicted dithiol-disulfide oxidoreductase (DUF899 family)